ncbi:hypothetical protein GE061_018964 [Apolygus lucorum]|uniref:Uncharacterized protein n=1 Tax=Apolygus lucorum TaxID=248454 RepID=A0A8S9X739_APOLU|nr:hypothetical protein GE061_018964 [Apolygus lucorum]
MTPATFLLALCVMGVYTQLAVARPDSVNLGKAILKPTRLEVDPDSSTAAKEWSYWIRTFENFIEESEVVEGAMKLKVPRSSEQDPRNCLVAARTGYYPRALELYSPEIGALWPRNYYDLDY